MKINADDLIGKVIDDKYHLQEELGRGSFGVVLKGQNVTEGRTIAVKLESIAARKRHLENEATVYGLLNGVDGFPYMYYYGMWTDYNCMVMKYLGPSVKKVFYMSQNDFDEATVAHLGMHCLYRLENLHAVGYLHQDIKPENMCVGTKEYDDSNMIYMVDFGTACKFKDINTGLHIEPGQASRIVGTCRYAALRMHYGYVCSRRDDLESMGYSLIYWLQGSLPWQSIKEPDARKKWKLCRGLKRQYIIESDYLKETPDAIQDYFRYIQSLGFYTKPNYRILRGIFRRLYKQTPQYEDRKTAPFIWCKNPKFLAHASQSNKNAVPS